MVDKDLDYNIIIIDNNSSYDDYLHLFNSLINLNNVRIIRSKINLGFSGGNMLGVQSTNADYLFFLNNDTVFLNDCLTILSDFMSKSYDAGLCTAQMYNEDGSFHHSFNYFPTLSLKLLGSSFLRKLNQKNYPDKKIEYNSPLQVDLVTGAAMFVDYQKFVGIGGFDTNYFLYCEEEDLAMKMKLSGHNVYLVPQAKFIHHKGKSTKRNYSIEKENFISLLYYHRKYSSRFKYLLLKIFYFIKTIKKGFSNFDYVRLAFFILNNADPKHSLRYKQKISNDPDKSDIFYSY
jgi:GT2 family glycosyltransferase